MALRNKLCFIALALIVQLLFFGEVRAQETQSNETGLAQETTRGPEPHKMKLISFEPWVVEGQVLGSVAVYVYDDVTTERPADYWELYDHDGDLVAVSWFDNMGIRKTAVDRGLVEEKDQLEGVFVVILDGEAT
jgi:hypothetical protein